MARGMNVIRRTGTTVPRIQTMIPAVGQTFKKFAVVTEDAGGNIVEVANGATSILGLALQGAFTGPGYDLPNSSITNTLVQGAEGLTSVAVADREQEFSARGVNGGTDPVLPLQTNVGEQYGIVKVGDDWCINFADVVNLAVQITAIHTAIEGNFFDFKFLEAVLVQP